MAVANSYSLITRITYMSKKIVQALTAVMLLLAMAVSYLIPQPAYSQSYYYTRPRHRSVFHSHPILSRTLTGGAVGAATGALVGAVTRHHRAGKGALIGGGIGAGLGAGLGLFRNRQYNGHWF
jgi:hypothetical protein